MTERPFSPEPDAYPHGPGGTPQPTEPVEPPYGYVADFAGYAPQPTHPTYPGQPGYPGYPARAPETSGRAIAVMVLGITSVALCWLGLIPAIVAVAMATRARREIEESGGRLTGLGMVTAGRITSWITIGATAALALLVLAIVLLGNSVSTNSGPGPLPG